MKTVSQAITAIAGAILAAACGGDSPTEQVPLEGATITLEGYFAATAQASEVVFGSSATIQGADFVRVYEPGGLVDVTVLSVVLQTTPVVGSLTFTMSEPEVGKTYNLTTSSCETVAPPCSLSFIGLERAGDPPFTTREALSNGALTVDSLTLTRIVGRFSGDAAVSQGGEQLGTVRIRNGKFAVPRPPE